MEPLNILVLHRLGDPSLAPAFLQQHVFSMAQHTPHQILFHDTSLDLPQWVKDTAFDAIVLDVTFLCARWAPGDFFQRQLQAYEFVKYSDAVKIACPQDEYDCHALLDNWMVDWKVDTVFSVISSFRDILYPRYSQTGSIRLAYTGYISDALMAQKVKPFEDRTIDLGYRARKLPPYFGRIGETKTSIGVAVQALAAGTDLHADIALGSGGTLVGQQWLDFINNSKFTLGSNSGSSLLDPVGAIQRKVRAYLRARPGATFDEVEAHCFAGLDGRYAFTAISPRVMEAAVLESAQIMVDGHYSGLLRPDEHYIPIRADASNFDEVRRKMADVSAVARMRRVCKEALLDVPALRADYRAKEISKVIEGHLSHRVRARSTEQVAGVIQRYAHEVKPRYAKHWKRALLRAKLVGVIDQYPGVSRMVRKSHEAVAGLLTSRRA